MWQYFWAHTVYHLLRWFPENNRVKARIVVGIFTAAILIPQIVVLALPHSGRYCSQPLLEMLIVSVVLTFCLLGFACLFLIMDPIPWEVKLAFHIFGGVNMIVAIILAVYTSKASDCSNYTAGLYYYSIAAMVLSLLTLIYFGLLVPFWVVNKVFKSSVLNRKERDGLCYEPVMCCSCVWHI